MGFFDRFRKRVKEVVDDTDLDALTTEEDSEEAEQPITETISPVEEEWDDLPEIEVTTEEPKPIEDDEWDDWDDEPEPLPVATLSKKERKLLEREKKRKEKKKKQLAKKGYDVDQVTRPDGSKVDLHVMRSTTGRKLVEVEQAPRKSVGKKTVETDKGTEFDIDLGGGVVEKGGRIIKDGPVFDELLEELELVMLEADMGSRALAAVLVALRSELIGSRLRRGADLTKVIEASLKRALRSLLSAGYWDFNATIDQMVDAGDTPVIVMMVGVNGTGKTTTIGKLTKFLQGKGKSVLIAAGDTYRAAATEQLSVWGERNNVTVISHATADPSSVIFDAVNSAKAKKIDVVIADTAGRLPTQKNLIDEITKIKRVITKCHEEAPQEILLVLDANTGQNAITQLKTFDEALGISGLIMTKLDGTAKGGVLAAIAKEFPTPVRFIGVGEGIDDLREFNAKEYAEGMFE